MILIFDQKVRWNMAEVRLTKERMKEAFLRYLDDIFELPEIISGCVKEINITRENKNMTAGQAFEAGFHDIYSDTDLFLRVRLPKDSPVTPEDYMKRMDRFGVTDDTALGWMFVPADHVCRVIFKNGMRYDLIFEFEYEGDGPFVLEPCAGEDENANWPTGNISRFWFIQIQALGKLYRRDYLISAHLANMNCNDTLVMQMIKRDLEYGTSHHRYGHSEQLEYAGYLGKMPYGTGDPVFDQIADRLYAAAKAYDRLVKDFYPGYQDRSDDFFAIWDSYTSGQVSVI